MEIPGPGWRRMPGASRKAGAQMLHSFRAGLLASFALAILPLPASANHPLTGLCADLPLSFEANRGQTDPQVKFLARGNGYELFLSPVETALYLNRGGSRAAVRIRPLGTHGVTAIEGLDLLPGKSNYFTGGEPGSWRRGIPNYARVRYRELYPGIDLVFGITLGNTKVRLHRARQEFKKLIEARCDFYRNELSCKPASPECCTPQPAARR